MGQFCMDSTGPRSGRRGDCTPPKKSVPFRPIGAFRTVCAGPAQRQRAYTEIAYRVKVKKCSPASQGATVTGLSKCDSPDGKAQSSTTCTPDGSILPAGRLFPTRAAVGLGRESSINDYPPPEAPDTTSTILGRATRQPQQGPRWPVRIPAYPASVASVAG